MQRNEPVLHIHRLIEQARPPQRADRSAAGTLPTRAYRYCEAATSATGFGWWVFPPMDLQLIWDGDDIYWHYDGASDWMQLAPAVQFPDFAAAFDRAAPPSLRGCSPPFLTALPEPGLVQMWTGLMVRTAEDWSALVRAPANLALPGGYAVYEGLVETDRWFGPLITNLRLTQTNKPVRFRADFPLIQVQPVPRIAYAEQTLNATAFVPDMASMGDREWRGYEETIAIPCENPDRPFGAYAVAVRKRRQSGCPVHPGRAEAHHLIETA
jgi:hypothetical protein